MRWLSFQFRAFSRRRREAAYRTPRETELDARGARSRPWRMNWCLGGTCDQASARWIGVRGTCDWTTRSAPLDIFESISDSWSVELDRPSVQLDIRTCMKLDKYMRGIGHFPISRGPGAAGVGHPVSGVGRRQAVVGRRRVSPFTLPPSVFVRKRSPPPGRAAAGIGVSGK
jgi:hypothetical protein